MSSCRNFLPPLTLAVVVLNLAPPAFGQETTGLLGKSLDLVHQVENSAGVPALSDAQRIDLLAQAITAAQQAPNHRLKGHRVLAIQAIRSAIAEIQKGDPDHEVATYLHTADTELTTSISLAGGSVSPALPPAANPTSETNTLAPTPSAISPVESDEVRDAVENDDPAKLKTLLQENPNLVFSRDKNGDTPLFQAVSSGHQDVADLLLAGKADVNATNKYNQTSLSMVGDSKDLAELLLDHGAGIETRDNTGDTPLLGAAKDGNANVAEMLLEKGARVDAGDNTGCTPLIWAAIQGHAAIAQSLLAHAAGVNAASPGGQTALSSAAMNGHQDVAELLLAHGANVSGNPRDGVTPLHWAAGNGHKELAELLLAHGADVNATSRNGFTPLQSAELYRHDDIADLLRQHGGRESDRSPSKGDLPGTFAPPAGAAPLLAAARAGDLEKVKALLQDDPTLVSGKVDDSGTTALLAAAASSHKDVVEFLIASHADVDARDILGKTALSYAATQGDKDVAELLLAAKADPNLGDDSNLAPLFQAALMGRPEIADLLLSHGAHVNVAGTGAWAGVTPLYIASANGSVKVVEVLLAHGADVEARGADGLTPLQIAVKNHHDTADLPENDVADLLRSHGAK